MLAIYHFKFLREGCEGEVSFMHIVQGDSVLIHQVHPIDEFTIVRIVGIGEDIVQEPRT